jgi:hypothetical protein
VISQSDVCKITGVAHPTYAARRFQHLEDILKMSVRRLGDVWEISWPKFPEFQSLPGRSLPESAPAPASSLISKRDKRPEGPEQTLFEPEKRHKKNGRNPWLNILSRKPGTDADKMKWIEDNIDRIEAEADKEFKDEPSRRQRNAAIRSKVLGWYDWHLKHPHGKTDAQVTQEPPLTPAQVLELRRRRRERNPYV